MTKTIENLFIYSATYTALLPVILFFIYFQRTKNSRLLIILITYSWYELTTNLISFYISDASVVILYAIFTIAEYLLFAYCFYLVIKKPIIKKIIGVSCLFFVIFSIIYSLSVQYKILDSLPIGIETLLILTFSFYFMYEQMEEPSQILIYHRFPFWIVSGIMIYLAGSFFIYIFANQVDKQTRHEYWVFQNAFTIIKNFFFTISLMVFVKDSKKIGVRNKFSF
jgi:hypothetical protein